MTTFDVYTAANRNSHHWQPSTVTLGGLLDQAHDAPEVADKAAAGALFPGRLDGPGRRLGERVTTARTVLPLDFDAVEAGWSPDTVPWRSVAYETHSSTPAAPRWRVAVAVDREVSEDDLQRMAPALLKRFPGLDHKSLLLAQCMYLPARRPGVKALRTADQQDRAPLPVDDLVAEGEQIAPELKRDRNLRDPFGLPGLVGAFNRTYEDLDALVEAYGLPYTPAGAGRWHLDGAGSEAGMNEVAPGRWYSHHSGDPATDGARTAFDLVRLHRHAGLDADLPADTPLTDLPSHAAMVQDAKEDQDVTAELAAHIAGEFADGQPARVQVEVSSAVEGVEWLYDNMGQGALSGMFRRGKQIVHCRSLDAEGYTPPAEADRLNPLVEAITHDGLVGKLNVSRAFRVFKMNAKENPVDCMFPVTAARSAFSAPNDLPHLRPINGVTQTPMVREDGTVLAEPGYDPATWLLYLPAGGLQMPEVSAEPTRSEVGKAGALLLEMLAGFPFESAHDQANYLGALLTPLLRPLVPPPYRLVAITAHQSGEGKSLLGEIANIIHDGDLRAGGSLRDEAELRKAVTGILSGSGKPVVVWDNVTGSVKSATLDSLLTNATWSDRKLGVNEDLNLQNDRLWMLTSNNATIGGDLARRTLWVRLNAAEPEPHLRTFKIKDIKKWVKERRGRLLWALLTLIRAWVVAGKPVGPKPSSDSFGRWLQVLDGILQHADLGDTVGTVAHADTDRPEADEDAAELFTLLRTALSAFGGDWWTASKMFSAFNYMSEDLPSDADRSVRSLGKWLGYRDERWVQGHCIVQRRDEQGRPWKNRDGTSLWRVEQTPEAALADAHHDVIGPSEAGQCG